MRKYRNHRLLIGFVLFSIAMVPVAGNALDLTFKPRIEVGVMDYSFKQDAINIDSKGLGVLSESGYELSSTMPLLGVGGTVFMDTFFMDVYLQKAFSGSDKAINSLYHEDASTLDEERINSEFDREEYSLSVGYAHGKYWVWFAGYRKSTTNFTNSTSRNDQSFDTQGEPVNAIRSNITDRIDFKQDGFFLGGVYAFSFGEQSTLSLNLALAQLDGKFDSHSSGKKWFSWPDGHEGFKENGTRSLNFKGDTTGLNIGVTWNRQMGDNLGFSLGINGYSYDFDGESRQTSYSAATNGSDVEDDLKVDRTLSETVLRISAGLSYVF